MRCREGQGLSYEDCPATYFILKFVKEFEEFNGTPEKDIISDHIDDFSVATLLAEKLREAE